MEKNEIRGIIENCDAKRNNTVIRSDCNIPRKVLCPNKCCQCFGIYNNPTSYEEKFPACSSSELTIAFHSDVNDVIAFDLKNKANEYILSKLTTVDESNMNYKTCIFETDCYVLETHPSNDKIIQYDLVINFRYLTTED